MNNDISREIQRIKNLSDEAARAEYTAIDKSDFAPLISANSAREYLKQRAMKQAGFTVTDGILILNGMKSMNLPGLG